jgi:cytochrome c-type biogenesis protein CcmH/NrfG
MPKKGGRKKGAAKSLERKFMTMVKAGETALERCDLASGLEAFEAAHRLRPDSVEVLDALAELYLEFGKAEAAVKALKTSIRLSPDGSWMKWLYLAQIQEQCFEMNFLLLTAHWGNFL